MTNTDNTVKIAGALFIGAAIGGLLGILFAPQKGSKTRKDISGKSNGLTDEMNEKVQEFIEKFSKESESMKEKANHLMKNGLREVV